MKLQFSREQSTHGDGQRFVLHTAAGDRTFLPGVNLGTTSPGHRPGEMSVSTAQYRAWFAAMSMRSARGDASQMTNGQIR